MEMTIGDVPRREAIDFLERREMAVHAVANHLQQHGLSLLNVAEALGDEAAIGTVIDLLACCDAPLPAVTKVASSLRSLVLFLEQVALHKIERVEREVPGEILQAVLWHGARLTDRLRALETR